MLIFCFLANWNEFVFVFLLTSKAALRTLLVGINSFAGGMTRDYGTQFAALVIGTLPRIIFYALFNKRLAQGFASGALKG
jgi:raffinose/stachyose/melibiose transport system permease protein